MNKQNIYVTGAEQGSGKSIIMLAMMDMLSGYAGKIGFLDLLSTIVKVRMS